MSWNPTGITLGQAVEVLLDDGTAGYGSGYLISPTLVLTARHVTDPGGRIEIVHAGRRIPAAVAWHGRSAEVDAAVLSIAEAVDALGISVPAFGDLSRASVRRVPFDAVGYPRHKQRVVGGMTIRDTDQISGEIPAGANLKTGVLDLLRDGRPLTVGDDWAGLSGAAVFCRGLLVGVVTEAEQHGPLRALPLAPLLAQSGRRLEPYQEPADSTERLLSVLRDGGVPARVLPARRRPSYRQAEELVAATPDLAGRDADYEQLRQVAQSDVPYSLWQAVPWAGKTTLAAHFAASPPAGLDVVSFFISRSRGQQAPQYWAAVGDQLAAIVDEPAPAQPELAFADLWIRARDQVSGQGRRLVLLVDGVDENSQPPPIVQDLPRDPGPGAHVAVFTRPTDEVFHDLLDHPLGDGPEDTSRCARFELASSGLARDLGRRALIDLRDLLTMNDRAPRQVLGLLAAVGPLSVTDIAAILATEGVAADEGDVRRGVAAASRVLTAIGGPAELYAVAHEALREEISRQVNPAAHVTAALAWAGRFAADGWPDTTPAALADGYLPLLLLTGDPALIVEIASQSRARYMQLRTGDDVAHGRELLAAFDAIAARAEPDLAAACALARARAELELGYDEFPHDIAIGWGRVGQLRRCEHLASYQAHGFYRVPALQAAAEWAAHHGDGQEARRFLGIAADEALAADGGGLSAADGESLLGVARFAYQIGEHQTAVRLSDRAAAAPEGPRQARAQSVQAVLAACGSEELLRAGGFRQALESPALLPADKVWGFVALATSAARYRQPDLASALFDEAETAAHQLRGGDAALALLQFQVAEGALAAGDTHRARRLIGAAWSADQHLAAGAQAVEVTCEAARLAAETGDGDRAKNLLDLAETLIQPYEPDDWPNDVACAVGVAAARSGDRTRALRLFWQAHDAAAASIIRDTLTASVAEAAARAGETDLAVQWLHEAELLTREHTLVREQLKWAGALAISCLPEVAGASARSGQAGAVLQVAQAAAKLTRWNIVMGAIAGLARAGAITEAQLAVALLPDRADARDRAAALIAQAAATAGDWRLAADTAAQVSSLTPRNATLEVVGHTAAEQGEWQLAEQTAGKIAHSPGQQISVLADAAAAAMKSGQETAATRILLQLPDGWPRLKATLQAMQAAQRDFGGTSQVTALERAFAAAVHGRSGPPQRRDRVHNLIFLVRAASTAGAAAHAVLPRLLAALADAVRDVDDPVSRTFDACDAADSTDADDAARSTLLAIAEEATVQVDDTDQMTALESVIRASARHGDHERVDRLLPLLATSAGDEIDDAAPGSRETVAETAAYAARFGYADRVISDAAPWERHDTLLAAIRGALDAAPHRTDAARQAEARKWMLRWLLAALRTDLDPELARLMVMMCPDVASLALSWFAPSPLWTTEPPPSG
jgi:hypothetical protein